MSQCECGNEDVFNRKLCESVGEDMRMCVRDCVCETEHMRECKHESMLSVSGCEIVCENVSVCDNVNVYGKCMTTLERMRKMKGNVGVKCVSVYECVN